MSDFYEIDFLDVESSKSGDAITIRYQADNISRIHVVDGGFLETGNKVVEHINSHYNYPNFIDHVVVTHPDGDHACGLRKVLEEFTVGALWMLRPWLYANELIDRFARFKSVENLIDRLKEIYPHIAALEEIAIEKNIPIREPFQGAQIGMFTVMSPTKSTYFDLIVDSDKTPESMNNESITSILLSTAKQTITKVVQLISSAWGHEVFSSEETSAENNMSVIQYANLCNKKILLTGDAGRRALLEAADYASKIGLNLPGIDTFQIPHHGSRRNVSTEILNLWLGEILPIKLQPGHGTFSAIVSAALQDKDHPRKSVLRAIIHRGGKVTCTDKGTICANHNAPIRHGWYAVNPIEYPEQQEE